MKTFTKNSTVFLVVLCLLLNILVGCSLVDDTQPSTAVTPTPSVTPEAQAPAEQQPEIDAEENGSNNQSIVAIYIGDSLYGLAPFGVADVIKVDQGDGKINEVTLTDDAVYMSHSTCDNQDCVKQGEITIENHETRILMDWIICLPNQITIEFISGDKQ